MQTLKVSMRVMSVVYAGEKPASMDEGISNLS